MKWPLPLLLAYLLLALQSPVSEALRFGNTSAAPSLVFPLVVFFALLAPTGVAIWTALAIGLAVDLTTLRGENALVIAGPHALGYAIAAYFVITVRPMVMRRNPITLAVLALVGEILASVVIVFIFAVRRTLFWGAWSDGLTGSLLSDLWQRIIGACFTGAAALALAAIFFLLLPYFNFQEAPTRRPFSRRF